jgi:hypothetical protein
MVYVEQGYYDGTELADRVFNGLTLFNADSQFMANVKFGSQVEFNLPPIFNKDTAGFAVIKAGSKKVEVVFDTPYIAQPIVNATISFEDTDNMTDADADTFFADDIKSLVINKSQNGFTIILNKNATRDTKFSWTALQVKDAKTFESIIPGLTLDPVDPPTDPAPSQGDPVGPPSDPVDPPTDPNLIIEEVVDPVDTTIRSCRSTF